MGAEGKVVCFKVTLDLTRFIHVAIIVLEACLRAYCFV